MIILTGAAGFIGSCVAARLNEAGYQDLVLVDDFSHVEKRPNYKEKSFLETVEREIFFDWVKGKEAQIESVIHLGARTDTTEMDESIFQKLNLEYSQRMWEMCAQYNLPLVYASSAATYGGGERGFEDDASIIGQLRPMNPYGRSKNDFDIWALAQSEKPPFWAGLKFFNVFGPNEYHKGRMASVVLHTFRQIKETGGMKLFRSHRDDFEDGAQSRDFIYVKDVSEVILFLVENRPTSGIYNLGTGIARSFNDLASSVFRSMGLAPNISFMDTPEDIRDTYQYYTCAAMERLRKEGYEKAFFSLESGVEDYVKNFLLNDRYL